MGVWGCLRVNYYPRYPGHYVAKTLHLTMEQDGAYTRLLDWCYLNERAIPHDARYAITRAMTASERKAVDAMLAEFFVREGAGWENDRALNEIAAAQPKIAAARANGKRGGRPKKTQEETQQKPSGFTEITQDEPSAKAPQSPILIDQELESARSKQVIAWKAIRDAAGYGPNQAHTANDPRLIAAVDAGVTAELFADVAAEAARLNPPKPFGWVVATALGRHRDAAKPPGASHANPVRLSAAERVRAHAIDGELADQRAGFGADGHTNLVGSDG